MLAILPFNQFIAVSQFTASSLIKAGIKPDRVQLIYNGIDYQDHLLLQRDNKLTNNKFTFTYFGRVGYSKGLDVLLEATANLVKLDNNFILQIITSREPLFNKMLELIHDYTLSEYVVFRHELEREELFTAIRKSDAIVIPSYSEGFCFAAVETMAIGTPIISSGRGALKEVIGGKHIELSELTAEELSMAMRNAMNGSWSDKPMKRFPIDETIEAHIALYDKILKR
jgi:glycosyltransferase involved in cell wall biosynthesis